MKKFIYILSVFMILSCNSFSKNKEIAGKWEMAEFKPLNLDVNTEIPEEGKEIVLSTIYIFNNDSIVIITSNFHDNIKGTYYIGNDSLILSYTVFDKKLFERYKILEINSNKMVLEQSFDDFGDFNFFLDKIQQ